MNPEHIKSDVLVDFTEVFNADPRWKPDMPTKYEELSKSNVYIDEISFATWKAPDHGELLGTNLESVVYNDGMGALQFNAYLRHNAFLKRENNQQSLIGDELALLPRRMFAYAVWDRKFVQIVSRYLKRATQKGEESRAFLDLQIDLGSKRLIESLLKSHFKRKRDELDGMEVTSQDLIRGKGRGIIILLHGEPGVRKTATAEAVAHKYEKPLFPITCGDLGFTPEGVEKSLKDIFRLAHLWACVLLLDEAEVFISLRDKNDLQRNALVSVFLRVLEYYNGVLFLTTNRVGVLDEAIKSRTRNIFQHNINRLNIIELQRKNKDDRLFVMEKEVLDFAETHYMELEQQGMGYWIGRQIRNAFLIAASLAHLDGNATPGLQKQLRRTHFETVAKTTLLYDSFRSSILNGPDSYVARERNERNDAFGRQSSAVPGSNHHRQSQYPQQHHASYPNSHFTSHNEAASPREPSRPTRQPDTSVIYEQALSDAGYGAQNAVHNRGSGRNMDGDGPGTLTEAEWQPHYDNLAYR